MSQEEVQSGGSNAEDDGRELDGQISRYLQIGLPVATLVCAVVAGVLQGPAAVVLVLAAGALVSVIAIFWASVRTLVGETALSGADAYAIGAPRAEEEQKRAVLRALKDLEFERSVGKISDEDYQALVAKYRTEAKRLLRLLEEDAQPAREKVEVLVKARLVREGLAEAPPGDEAKPREGKGKKKGKPSKASNRTGSPSDGAPVATEQASKQAQPADDARPACPSCGTRNDVDAVFCKKCGARRLAADEGDVEDEGEDVEQEGRKEASS
jgi:hypothetical protein